MDTRERRIADASARHAEGHAAQPPAGPCRLTMRKVGRFTPAEMAEAAEGLPSKRRPCRRRRCHMKEGRP